MRNQLSILDVPVDVITMKEAVQRVQNLYSEPGLHTVVTVNAEMVMRARHDKELHQILKQADMAVPDGAGVLWAAEQLGQHIPERVAGCDLAVALLQEASQHKTPVYFFGAEPGVAEQAVKNMEALIGPLQVVGIHSGFFEEQEEVNIIKAIEDGGAKLVLVALGVPKQEKWITSKLSHLDKVVAIGLGGSFDVMAGTVKRAPQWMQRNRLEWLYRLLNQPQRIGRMMALPKFMWAVKQSKK